MYDTEILNIFICESQHKKYLKAVWYLYHTAFCNCIAFSPSPIKTNNITSSSIMGADNKTKEGRKEGREEGGSQVKFPNNLVLKATSRGYITSGVISTQFSQHLFSKLWNACIASLLQHLSVNSVIILCSNVSCVDHQYTNMG